MNTELLSIYIYIYIERRSPQATQIHKVSASLAFQAASASPNNVRLPAEAPRFSIRNTPSAPSARCEAFCPHGSFYVAPKDDQTSDNARKRQAIVSRTIASYWVCLTLWVKATYFDDFALCAETCFAVSNMLVFASFDVDQCAKTISGSLGEFPEGAMISKLESPPA